MLTIGTQDGETQIVESDTDIRLFLDDVKIPGALDTVDQFSKHSQPPKAHLSFSQTGRLRSELPAFNLERPQALRPLQLDVTLVPDYHDFNPGLFLFAKPSLKKFL